MFELRIIAAGRTLSPFDLPAVIGRDAAAREIGLTVEALIAFMDDLEGDPDAEDGDGDACTAHDDDPHYVVSSFGRGDGYAGDPDDAEEDDPAGGSADDVGEVDEGVLGKPAYADDQSAGPTNYAAAQRAYHERIGRPSTINGRS